MSSHMFEEVERTCDRAAIIREGRLVAVEEMEKLKESRQKIIVVSFKDASMAEAFAAEFPKAGYQAGSKMVTAKVGRNLDSFIKKPVSIPLQIWMSAPRVWKSSSCIFTERGQTNNECYTIKKRDQI